MASNSHPAPGSRHRVAVIETFLERHFTAIVGALMVLQVSKGLPIYQNPYARAHYLWSYDHGFIKRGLIGTLAQFLSEGEPYRLPGVINCISYISLFLFLLVFYRFIVRHAKTATERLFSLLLLSSPFLTAMSSLLGYYDCLLLTLLLLAHEVIDRSRVNAITLAIILVVALLVHELAILFVIIPVMLQLWLHPQLSRHNKYYLIAGIGIACLALLWVIQSPPTGFMEMLSARMDQNAAVLSTRTGEAYFRKYGAYAIDRSMIHDLYVMRLAMLVPLMPLDGFFILFSTAIAWFHFVKVRQLKTGFLYLACCYAPLLVIMVAWDCDRFICLASATAYLNFFTVQRFLPALATAALDERLYQVMLVVAVVSALSFYPLVRVYAEGETVLGIHKQETIFLPFNDRILAYWDQAVVRPNKRKPQ